MGQVPLSTTMSSKKSIASSAKATSTESDGSCVKKTFHQVIQYTPWAPKNMKNKGFGHLKTMLFTIKTSKNVYRFWGPMVPWIFFLLAEKRHNFPNSPHLMVIGRPKKMLKPSSLDFLMKLLQAVHGTRAWLKDSNLDINSFFFNSLRYF